MRLDGTHYRTWSNTDQEPGLYLGAGHLAQLPDEGPLMVVRDLMDPTQDRTYNTLEQAKAVLGSYCRHQPAFTVVAHSINSSLPAFDELDTYRMQDHLEFLLEHRNNSFKDPPPPMLKRSINWPTGGQPRQVDISPQQNSLFYFVKVARTPLLLGWLHRTLPRLVKLPTTRELWVSRLDGGGIHKIGSAQLPFDAAENLTMEMINSIAFYGLNWLPDGKHISFIHRGMLYVVPAEPSK